MNRLTNPRLCFGAALLFMLSFPLRAAEANLKEPSSYPAWITELSVSGREGYDSSVFAASNERATYAVSNRTSTVSTLGAKIGLSVSAFWGQPKDRLALAYSADANWYDRIASQNYRVQRVFLQSKGMVEPFAWTVDSASSYVDGNREAPDYYCYSSYGNATPRERLAQIQERASLSLRYTAGPWFARASAGTLYYDLLAHHHNPIGAYAGYQNYVDRNDVNARVDFGWKILKETFFTAGACTGVQYQQALPWATSTSSSHYRRLLVGVEGKPFSWLSVTVTGGPDFRNYPDLHSGVRDRTPIVPFLEGSATASLGTNDTLTLNGKQWRWVSSTGVAAIDERLLALVWKHAVGKGVALQFTAQYQQNPYVTPTLRNDLLFSGIAQVQWNVSRQLLVTVDYTRQNAENNLNGPAYNGREFKRNLTGASMKYSF